MNEWRAKARMILGMRRMISICALCACSKALFSLDTAHIQTGLSQFPKYTVQYLSTENSVKLRMSTYNRIHPGIKYLPRLLTSRPSTPYKPYDLKSVELIWSVKGAYGLVLKRNSYTFKGGNSVKIVLFPF